MVHYEHVRSLSGGGWRVIRVGPRGGHTTVAWYREEDPARTAAYALEVLKIHEMTEAERR